MSPPSVDTSTPPSTPPALSLAVPTMFTSALADTLAPEAGEVMLELGGAASLEALAATRPLIRVGGGTPMSANKFIVACCMRTSTPTVPSGLPSRPHDHCTVPAPKTSTL